MAQPASPPAAVPVRPPAAGSPPPRRRSPQRTWRLVKVGVWVLCLLPFAHLVFDAITDNLQAEPIKEITHRTGWWALFLLTVTLAVTPLRHVAGWKQVVRLRRLLGLFGFFYATLHVLTYFGLDQFFSFEYIVEDIAERPFITVGFAAWVLLIPLAVTSTQGWMRRLGTRWQKLHRIVYVAAGLGVLHFYWAVKADTQEPLLFAGILLVLMAIRLPFVRQAIKGLRPRRP